MTDTRDGDLAGGALPAASGTGRPKPDIPREVELKYLVRDLEALRSWLARDWGGALDGVEFGDERTVEVEDRYIDTAYGALGRAGFGARDARTTAPTPSRSSPRRTIVPARTMTTSMTPRRSRNVSRSRARRTSGSTLTAGPRAQLAS